jgi:hypothetical protein
MLPIYDVDYYIKKFNEIEIIVYDNVKYTELIKFHRDTHSERTQKAKLVISPEYKTIIKSEWLLNTSDYNFFNNLDLIDIIRCDSTFKTIDDKLITIVFIWNENNKLRFTNYCPDASIDDLQAFLSKEELFPIPKTIKIELD